MNGQLKIKQYTGLALIVAGCGIDAYYNGLERTELIEHVPAYISMIDTCVLVTGSYLVGHYNGYKCLGDKVKRRFERGLRYDPPSE